MLRNCTNMATGGRQRVKA